ncbi:MAG: EamA family transporter [Acidimicrobiales bacterium]|nr:EamA family transporter [Actinomycetota bacterium]MBP91002.1 EamA family transporter [Acidimicrobiaceae bacterium]MDP6280426.1 EamA family transporter [Acidimicrobiales bacterium]MDP7118464.1 EamA family transporter [Acidimicrobiales bacterium]MDP7411862.1 EamA family transporter [Acidimicrobiales bacterium]
MAALLALLAASLFGLGDFCGGLASRRISALRVVASTHIIGLLLVLAAAPLMAEAFSVEALLLGALAGAFGMIGIGLLYRGLGRGPMAVVAPITAVNSAAIPVVWGLAFGEQLSTLHVLGILVGLLAIVLVSRIPGDATAIPKSLVLESMLAGSGFAAFFIVIDAAQDQTAPWPLVGARIASVLLTLALLALRGGPRLPLRMEGVTGLIVATGVFDMAANVAFLLAVNTGLLSLVSVLAALYPATTVVLARVVLSERMSRTQVLGMFGAVGSVALIALG